MDQLGTTTVMRRECCRCVTPTVVVLNPSVHKTNGRAAWRCVELVPVLQSEVAPRQSSQVRRKLLHAVADVLETSGAVCGSVERIISSRIRVPLLRFVEAETGITCDLSCCNDAAVLKAELLKSVVDIDERTVHLIRLVLPTFAVIAQLSLLCLESTQKASDSVPWAVAPMSF